MAPHGSHTMINFTIDSARQLTTCRASGRLTFLDVARAVQTILEQTEAPRGFNALFVIEDASAFLSCSDLRALKPLVKAWSERHCQTRWAIVLPSISAKVLAELVLRDLQLSVSAFECFVTEAEALAWLASAPALAEARA